MSVEVAKPSNLSDQLTRVLYMQLVGGRNNFLVMAWVCMGLLEKTGCCKTIVQGSRHSMHMCNVEKVPYIFFMMDMG
jgi:hypothetical protein